MPGHAALFTAAMTWQPPECPLTGEWGVRSIGEEMYSALKSTETPSREIIQVDPDAIVSGETSQLQEDTDADSTFIRF